MKIGDIDLGEKPVVLAPMEDVTDIGFRTLCRKLGASMVYSEFVSSEALTRNIKSTIQKLRIDEKERPVAIQIYGKDPSAMAEAARMVEEISHPDIIDINFGCPVKKIAGKGAGAGLLQNIPLMLQIATETVKAVKTPVTVKTRLGWDCNQIIIRDLALQLQDTGIQALTIHGRTRSQMYKGEADWQPISDIGANQQIHIPIIGNGDIDSADKALNAFNNYSVDAIMVGRATFGRPWIFKEIHDKLHPESPINPNEIIQSEYTPMSANWKLDVLKEQARLNVERIDEKRGILHTRRHIAASPVLKGIPDFRQKRIALLQATTLKELYDLMESIRPCLIEESDSNLNI